MKPNTPTTQATLEFEPDTGETPTGALLTGDGRRRVFSGWIELASAIEDWRQAEHGDGPLRSRVEGPHDERGEG